MNGDLIDILELIVVLKPANRHKLCDAMTKPFLRCEQVNCSECLLNTSKVYIYDYPIRIIEVKGKLNGQ